MAADEVSHLDLQLLSNFIHQVINPLNGVIGTLDNIIDGQVPAARVQQRLVAVRAQLEHSVSLVRNLAFFARLSAAEEPEIAYTSEIWIMPELVIQAALFYQEEGLSRSIKIHLEDRETQYAVMGVPDLLRQVFMNLFDNAVKYADPGSSVRVRIRIQKQTGSLIVEVESVGAVLHFDERQKIFELGFRGREAKQLVASGTGLGLYICRWIIEKVHAGQIEFEGVRATRSTIFRIRLPEGFVNERPRVGSIFR